MAKTPGRQASTAPPKGPDKISLAKLPPEAARKSFKALLLSNPNYFGNLKESEFQPVLNIAGDTAYENIGCVGFNPQLNRLEAVVYINQATGYDGDVCSGGSQEFVRFYLSYDGGATWQDQGLTSFTVYDVPGPKPLEYDVTVSISPSEKFCFFQNLPLARAILSWNAPPPASSPDWTPVWGNVVDAQIQIAGFEIIVLGQFLADAKAELPAEYKNAVDLTQPIQVSPPKALSAADRHTLYNGKNVPGHRYLFPELQHALEVQATDLEGAPSALAGISDLNLTSIIEQLLNTDGDTSYEELDCVGLNPNLGQLVGIINVKQPAGYSGGPCTAGSQEYVAFWVDWGSGWTYAGTTSVNVHDFSAIPTGGLQYSVFLPIDLASHRQPCEAGPKTAKVRAVLSWDTPPSTTNPYASVVWGNSEETQILIDPGPAVAPGQQIPFLSRVGDIDESLIDSSGLITDAYALETGNHYVHAPFGGRITIAGFISNPTPGMKYRVMKKPHGAPDSAYAPIVNEPAGLTLTIDEFNGSTWTQTEQMFHDLGDGYYPYENYSWAHTVEANIMGVWYTTAADDGNAYDLRIDLSVDGNPADDAHSNVVTVLVNQTTPVAALDLNLGGGAECGFFSPGDTITGNYTASSEYFGHFSFVILPAGPANGVLPTPPAGASTWLGGAIADPGVSNGAYTLNTGANPGPPPTGPMAACGYSLTVQVWDRTNVDSGATTYYNQASVGFCLNAGD
ncbi:MAG TPA: hypothetical protein VKW70_00395 [Terriglobia bacterium]|nr:hypothetical protein [Terriglobia bacterium]